MASKLLYSTYVIEVSISGRDDKIALDDPLNGDAVGGTRSNTSRRSQNRAACNRLTKHYLRS